MKVLTDDSSDIITDSKMSAPEDFDEKANKEANKEDRYIDCNAVNFNNGINQPDQLLNGKYV
jgi:hypothetical protein